MIQNNYKDSVKEVSGDVETTGFNIEVNESMFQMLTSNVYNDPTLAVVREWSTNACDACIAGNVPVKYDVHLPTIENKVFSVRDYGIGLSPEDIVGMFSNLGASTKRDSNKFNGTLGIGRMAGLAVSDSFTVDSYFNGKLYSYVISVQKGVPVTMNLGVSDTNEPNGLKMSVPVETKDIENYQNKAEELYRYFDHKPNLNLEHVNVELSIKNRISDDWFIKEYSYYDSGKNFVVMSQVAYEVPRSRLINTQDFTNLVVKVPPGAVTFNPGRESLSLNKETVEYMNNVFKDVKNEYIEKATLALALTDNDKELVDAYVTAKNNAPYNLRKEISIEPFVSDKYKNLVESYNKINKRYDDLTTTHNFYKATNSLLSLSYKRANYAVSKKLDTDNGTMSVPCGDFFSANHVIVDMKTNFRQTLNGTYLDSRLVTWQREPKADIEEAVEMAKEYLDGLGISYKLASELITIEKSESSSKSSRKGLYASDYNRYENKFIRSEKVDEEDAGKLTVYANLSGTNPDIEGYQFRDIYAVYDLIQTAMPYTIENEEGKTVQPKIRFCGISKKYRKQVEGLPNWVDIMSFIESMAYGKTFIRPLNVELPLFNRKVINADNLHKYPVDIQNYYKEIVGYMKFNNSPVFVPNDDEAQILKDVGANFETYTPVYDVDVGMIEEVYSETLPLITDAYGREEKSAIRIAELEEFYEVHRNHRR